LICGTTTVCREKIGFLTSTCGPSQKNALSIGGGRNRIRWVFFPLRGVTDLVAVPEKHESRKTTRFPPPHSG
jgi:hypothetical protein